MKYYLMYPIHLLKNKKYYHYYIKFLTYKNFYLIYLKYNIIIQYYININLYLKLFKLNKLYLSLISFNCIYKELLFINNIKFNKNKLKSNLNYSNKKLHKQKGLGKARIKNKKSPVFIGGIKLFKNKNNYLKIKINKKEWLKIFNLLVYIKKSFIIVVKNTILNISNIKNNKINFSKKNYLIILNYKLFNIFDKNIINFNDIKLINILKYNYLFIII